jgi:hypothetical protein
LCQGRFSTLLRQKVAVPVKSVDRRERNWMQVMEEYDSEEQSVEDDDDVEEGDSADGYEEDFVVPDDVIVYDSGKVVRQKKAPPVGPFGRPPANQKDCIIKTRDGEIITITWNLPPPGDDSDDEFQPEEMDEELDDDEFQGDDEFQPDEMSVSEEEVIYDPRGRNSGKQK